MRVCLWTQGCSSSPSSPASWLPGQSAEPTHLHNEAGGGLPLKEQLLLPLVGAQVLLPSAHGITAIDDDEDVGICPGSKDVAGEQENEEKIQKRIVSVEKREGSGS